MADRETLLYHKDKAAERNASILLAQTQPDAEGIVHSTYAQCLKGLHHCCPHTLHSYVHDGTRYPIHCDCACHNK